jgi:hypothetical protein
MRKVRRSYICELFSVINSSQNEGLSPSCIALSFDKEVDPQHAIFGLPKS